MKYKTLNFPDGMKLASIISKYIDTESIGDMTGNDFFVSLLTKLSLPDLAQFTKLLGLEEKDIEDNFQQISMETLIKNNLLDLLVTYKQIGFK